MVKSSRPFYKINMEYKPWELQTMVGLVVLTTDYFIYIYIRYLAIEPYSQYKAH